MTLYRVRNDLSCVRSLPTAFTPLSTVDMSATGDFGSAPDGVDLSRNQNASIKSSVISLMVIATFFVILRMIARTRQKGESLALDDFCVVLGLVSPSELS